MNCPKCGRFMKAYDYFTNDHLDSEETTWKCLNEYCKTKPGVLS